MIYRFYLKSSLSFFKVKEFPVSGNMGQNQPPAGEDKTFSVQPYYVLTCHIRLWWMSSGPNLKFKASKVRMAAIGSGHTATEQKSDGDQFSSLLSRMEFEPMTWDERLRFL